MNKIKFKWGERDCIAKLGQYNNNRLALLIEDADSNNHITIASINVPLTTLSDKMIVIKNIQSNEKLYNILIENKIISKEQFGEANIGYFKYPIHKILINNK